jgi:glycosyltransferase involved in cell wall biosynthesis
MVSPLKVAKPKIAIALNSVWNIVNFRANLITRLIQEQYDVVAIAPPDRYVDKLLQLGCSFRPIKMNTKGTNPIQDLWILLNLIRILHSEKPTALLTYTVKPNIYGSLACRYLKIPVINNIAGLGSSFIQPNWITPIVKSLYRFSFSSSNTVFFQNNDDLSLFVGENIVLPSKAQYIPGSGIDLSKFPYCPAKTTESEKHKQFSFLLVARMLWDKGVGEFIEAARILKKEMGHVNFNLIGALAVDNPSAISRQQMDRWTSEGIVNYLGHTDEIKTFIENSDCIVLPSYREGLPRTLLEAAAIGRPIITTDTPGCKDVVDHDGNGFLCQIKDANDLVDKMRLMAQLPLSKRIAMGKLGREMVENKFNEKLVIDQYMRVLKHCV